MAGLLYFTTVQRPGAHTKNPSRPRLGGVLHAPMSEEISRRNSSTHTHPVARRAVRRALGRWRRGSLSTTSLPQMARLVTRESRVCTRKMRKCAMCDSNVLAVCGRAAGRCDVNALLDERIPRVLRGIGEVEEVEIGFVDHAVFSELLEV